LLTAASVIGLAEFGHWCNVLQVSLVDHRRGELDKVSKGDGWQFYTLSIVFGFSVFYAVLAWHWWEVIATSTSE
jgi:hypothetical protein